ncbi:MAG: hypothetical protein P8K08_04240 [Fuerstiella sp.]|jgi:hypothetical protein|nr:hypothetical protein [Fuerstiella sp.]
MVSARYSRAGAHIPNDEVAPLLVKTGMKMNHFTGSIALLRHPERLENHWLTYWDARRQHFDFVTAERLDDESFRECLDREIAWVFDLRRGKDYIISSQARLHLDLPVESENEETFYVVEFYIADLYGKASRAMVELNKEVRWLTSDEVLSGQTSEGVPVNPSLVELLNRADVIARHTS